MVPFGAQSGGRQIRPPTMIHVDKMRILEENCLKERRVSAGGRITTDKGRMRASTTSTTHAAQRGLRRRDA